jgi:glutamate---cysteine ligase / carboxylate-amine ligase
MTNTADPADPAATDPAAPRSPVGAGEPLTVGVEEEFLLVHPVRGHVVPAVEDVLGALAPQLRVLAQHEYLTGQIEIGSAPVAGLDALGRSLTALRRAMADAAERAGVRMVAAGTAPLPSGGETDIVDTPRFQRMAESFGALSPGHGMCGCHVHVEIPDRDTGVQVLNHLRPWLPLLSAVAANSPFFRGRDTRYASWRSMLWKQWPSVGPPPYLESAEHYDASVRRLVRSGAALDEGMLYWYARLSAHLPTVELRIGDVCLAVDDAILLAALARALVATVLVDVAAGVPAPRVPHHLLTAAHWRAARDGLEGRSVDPATGETEPAWDHLNRLVDLVTPALERHGDAALVAAQLDRLRAEGTGAERQRRVVARAGSIDGLLPYLVAVTRGPEL